MNFSFQNPQMLLLLLPVGYALYRAYWNPWQPPASIPFPQAAQLESLEPDSSTLALKSIPRALVSLAACLLVLGLARPQRVQPLPPAGREGSDIMLVIDTSLSMEALDFNPRNRIMAAKEAAKDFIRNRKVDRIGITVFAETAQLQCPLTTDYAALLDFLDLVETGMLKSNGTAIGDGLVTAVNHLKESRGRTRTVILLTDGRSNSGEIDPMTAAQVTKAEDVKVYTIGTGVKGPALIPQNDPVFGRRLVQIPDDLDEASLIAIARITGGEYYRATSMKELFSIYEQIDKLEQPPVDVPIRYIRHDLYAWLLLPALFLLAGEFILTRTILLALP